MRTLNTIQLTVVGYYDFSTRKVYNTKADMLAAKKEKERKDGKQFAANLLTSIALEVRLQAARAALRVQGWSFKGYCTICAAISKIIAFNRVVCKNLKITF